MTDLQDAFQDAGKIIQPQHVGAVAGGVVRIGMGLEKQAVDADGDGGAGQRLDHGAVAAGSAAEAAGLLHAMGGVENHRHTQLAHLNQRPHIVDQSAVAEERPSFTQKHIFAAGGAELLHDMPHVPGGHELSLLHIDGPAGLGLDTKNHILFAMCHSQNCVILNSDDGKILATLPIGPALKIGFLRSLMRARYAVEPLGHYGLSKTKYTHFTSPIRRYADLVVHRVLFDHAGLPAATLNEIANHITTTERNFVIRVNGGVAEWVNVSKGAAAGDLIEVMGPLAVGDVIVKRATDEIRHGSTLKTK